jgi:hypothetical protein
MRMARLIAAPALITLAVTLLWLTGELRGWSDAWFSRTVGASIVGTTWLVLVFGIYFALKLRSLGHHPSSIPRAFGYSLAGALVLVGGAFIPQLLGVVWDFYGRLVYGWLLFASAALVTARGWPTLWKTLLAYGFAARAPVVVIMLLAFRGDWGTHYDSVPADFPGLALWPKFLWLGFFPQMILWVAFTVLVGMFAGTLAAGIARLREVSA